MLPELETVRAWCRIDGTEFDAVLPAMVDAAARLAACECGQPEDHYIAPANAMPTPVLHWVCANVAHWINNPEAAQAVELKVNPFLARLLDPYRVWVAPDPAPEPAP